MQDVSPCRSLDECGGSVVIHSAEQWLHALAVSQTEYLKRVEAIHRSPITRSSWSERELEVTRQRVESLEWVRRLNYQRGAHEWLGGQQSGRRRNGRSRKGLM